MSQLPLQAAPHDIRITDGQGEELAIKNGWFGQKTKVVKDRFGNKFESKSGLFGRSQTNLALPGLEVKRRKGLFGGSRIEGSTMFGDKVATGRGWFGRRKTTVDVSGSANMIKSLISNRSQNPALNPASANPPGTGAKWTGTSLPVGSTGSATPDMSASP